MLPILYAYIGKPTAAQIGAFLHALVEQGISISHLGKNDPPRKFQGTLEEAVCVVFSGTDLSNFTFARDAAQKLDFDIQIHNDPRWTHSTISASCPNLDTLRLVAMIAAASFDTFITIQGISGGSKEQPWEVVYVTDRCPSDIRSKFLATSQETHPK